MYRPGAWSRRAFAIGLITMTTRLNAADICFPFGWVAVVPARRGAGNVPRWQLRADGVGSVIMCFSHPPPRRGGGHFAFEMHLNPREQEGRITFGFAGLQDGAFSMAGPASARAMLGFFFGPQRAGIWVERLLQALCAMLGFCFGPQRAGMVAWSGPSTPIPVGPCSCFRHSADVLCIFCTLFPSSSIGHGACICTGACFPEGLPGFGEAAEDPEGWIPAPREIAPTW